MVVPSAAADQHAVSFGPFRLFPSQQLLLEDGNPVRLGSRALEILTALIEHAGEIVDKGDIIARVWPNTFIDENTLRVHVSGLRRALGDGQPGRRYVANVSGRGYRFVAPISLAGPEGPPAPRLQLRVSDHNLPLSKSRVIGRVGVIDTIRDQLLKRGFVTIVGHGGVGKTTVALALAEEIHSDYADGVRFVDLAPLEGPQFVSGALGATLGLSIHPQDAIPQLVEFLRGKHMLIVLDSCEHVIEAAALLAEQLVVGAPGIQILATSREALRAEGEQVHRLSPLDFPADPTGIIAAEALRYPAVQLFVERAAAILDGYELGDDEAPIVSEICNRLGGIALAIELAAARVDAFGIRQLAVVLDDRFQLLSQGKRTAQPRHRSLAAALDWSYEFLPETERLVLARLSVSVGAFTLGAAIAIARDDDTDVVQALANLVAKSLVSADLGDTVVCYRLLDTTRAYALQKLSGSGRLDEYSRRHALYQLRRLERAEADAASQVAAEWLREYGRGIDDIRAALNWSFSPTGDISVAIALTLAAIPVWRQLSLVYELRARLESALARLPDRPNPSEADELQLLVALGFILPHATSRLPSDGALWAKALALGEKLQDSISQGNTMFQWSAYCLYAGKLREGLAHAQRCNAIGVESGAALYEIIGSMMTATMLHYLGSESEASRQAELILAQDYAPSQRNLFSFQLMARCVYAEILWVRGSPEQALEHARIAVDDTQIVGNSLSLLNMLVRALCPISINTGDLTQAERSVEMLLECSAKNALNTWDALGRCLKGRLLVAKGDFAGLEMQQVALKWLREANFFFRYPDSLGALAQGVGLAGRPEAGIRCIDEALELVERFEERWCQPELLRIKGDLLLSHGSVGLHPMAEEHFQQALNQARQQKALSWELRAATSLAKLWRQDGKKTQARELLSAVYDQFNEGFDTIDLRTARALIKELC